MYADESLVVVFSSARHVVDSSELVQMDVTSGNSGLSAFDFVRIVSETNLALFEYNPGLDNNPIIRVLLLSALFDFGRNKNSIFVKVILALLAARSHNDRKRLKRLICL